MPVFVLTLVAAALMSPCPAPPVPRRAEPPVPPRIPSYVLTEHMWLVAITDEAVALPPAQQAAMVSPTLIASARLRNAEFSAVGRTDPFATGWLPGFPRSGLPVLLVLKRCPNGAGILQRVVALPPDEAGIVAVIDHERVR